MNNALTFAPPFQTLPFAPCVCPVGPWQPGNGSFYQDAFLQQAGGFQANYQGYQGFPTAVLQAQLYQAWCSYMQLEPQLPDCQPPRQEGRHHQHHRWDAPCAPGHKRRGHHRECHQLDAPVSKPQDEATPPPTTSLVSQAPPAVEVASPNATTSLVEAATPEDSAGAPAPEAPPEDSAGAPAPEAPPEDSGAPAPEAPPEQSAGAPAELAPEAATAPPTEAAAASPPAAAAASAPADAPAAPVPQAEPVPRDMGWVAAQVRDNYDLLNKASGQEGNVTMADVQAMLTNPDCPPELREACQFLADNPALFNALDVANGVNGVDGEVGSDDARVGAEKFSGLNGAAPSDPLTLGRSVRILQKYSDLLDPAAGANGKDGVFGRADMEALLQSPGTPPELKAAIRFFLDNEAMMNELDMATNPNKDELISLDDLRVSAERHPV